MTHTGVILYGPPASGKDTVTAALSQLNPEYTLFQRLKAGSGRTTGYRLTTADRIAELSRAGELLYRNSRYDAEYAIDKGGLTELFEDGRTPVLHMGQVEGVGAVEAYPARWLRVLLWCPREVTEERCITRGSTDVEKRLAVWEETRRDLLDHADTLWSLIIETDHSAPDAPARAIEALVSSGTSEPAEHVRQVLA